MQWHLAHRYLCSLSTTRVPVVPAHTGHHLMIVNVIEAQHSLEFRGSASLFGSGNAGTSPVTGPMKLVNIMALP